MFVVFYVLAWTLTAVRLALRRDRRTRRGVVETALEDQLSVGVGVSGLFLFVGHRFRSDEVARSIGWPTGNLFQHEVAYANLGFGITGVMSRWRSGGFRWATALASATFLLGTALTHVEDMRRRGNRSINNVVAILPDVAVPATLFVLLALDRTPRTTVEG